MAPAVGDIEADVLRRDVVKGRYNDFGVGRVYRTIVGEYVRGARQVVQHCALVVREQRGQLEGSSHTDHWNSGILPTVEERAKKPNQEQGGRPT